LKTDKTEGISIDILVCAVIAVTTLMVYRPALSGGFVFDDFPYIIENPHVLTGLSWENIKWAFGFKGLDHWLPVSFLSHMIDVQLFGLNPGAHHLENVIFHIFNSLLLFFVFRYGTGRRIPSAMAAALFALHPINVDSVAWVAERKNVLSTFFGLSAILAYVRYSRHRRFSSYLLVFVLFALGIMSKAMLMTLPFSLLLLDYWPLKRFQPGAVKENSGLFLEKIPLMALSAIAFFITSHKLQAQRMFVPADVVSMPLRVSNAIVSYAAYLWKMLWPVNLAVYYPYPETVPFWKAAAAALFVITVTVLVIRRSKGKPYLATGWFWYLGALVPVLGIKQANLWPAMADRWAYVPFIGVFIIVAWGGFEFFCRYRLVKTGLLISVTIFSAMGMATHAQTKHWASNVTLFNHAIRVTDNNHVAHNFLGMSLLKQGNIDAAINNFQAALRINPDYPETRNGLATALYRKGRIEEALTHYTEAVRLKPYYPEAYNNLGIVLRDQGRPLEAVGHFLKAIDLQPDYSEAYTNLGLAYEMLGRPDEAVEAYNRALAINGNDYEAHHNIALILVRKGQIDEAIDRYNKALLCKPDSAEIHNNLAQALFLKGRLDESILHFQEALKIYPGNPVIISNMNKVIAANNAQERPQGQ
jgi:protein O-mannosyl-transferase